MAPENSPGGSAELSVPIEELELPVRAYNRLRREGVHTVGDLVTRTPEQLLAIENIGPASVEEIRRRLGERGLTLTESDPVQQTLTPADATSPADAMTPAEPAAPAATTSADVATTDDAASTDKADSAASADDSADTSTDDATASTDAASSSNAASEHAASSGTNGASSADATAPTASTSAASAPVVATPAAPAKTAASPAEGSGGREPALRIGIRPLNAGPDDEPVTVVAVPRRALPVVAGVAGFVVLVLGVRRLRSRR